LSTPQAVERARALLEERRDELKQELEQIEQALAGLGTKRRGPGRPRGAARAEGGGKRRRRRRGGTRAEHALKHVSQNPGASASDIAGGLGIKPNYVYRVMAELEKDGKVRKEGRGYFAVAGTEGGRPVAAPSAPAPPGPASVTS
jgi:predicted Rossmann fold nucleotide-binding protein DprA/Smf involved in DNA uptake